MSRRVDQHTGLTYDAQGDARCPRCDGRLIVPLPPRQRIGQHPSEIPPARPAWCPSCRWKQDQGHPAGR